MSIIALLIALWPAKWNAQQHPIQTPATCYGQLQQRLSRCAVQHPDATSIQREVCESAARGRYVACIDGIGGLP